MESPEEELASYRGKPAENALHIAAKFGDRQMVTEILEKWPGLTLELNHDGLTPLHLACRSGNLEIVSDIIQTNPKLCLVKDRNGRTPLHTATLKGRLEIMKELLKSCPECVMELTTASETPLHVGVTHDQVKAVKLLVDWLKFGTVYWRNLIDRQDCAGNTVLHLATSRKQIHTIKLLLAHTSRYTVEVNAMNRNGFTAADILDVLPPSGKKDTEIEKVLRRAGALRAKDIVKMTVENRNHEVCIEFRNEHSTGLMKSENETSDGAYPLLLIAASVAVVTYLTADIGKQSTYLFHILILFNSMAFFTSVAMMTVISQEMKSCLLIIIVSVVGAYLCKLMAASPLGAMPVLLIGSLIMLAAALKSLALHMLALKYFRLLCTRLRVI